MFQFASTADRSAPRARATRHALTLAALLILPLISACAKENASLPESRLGAMDRDGGDYKYRGGAGRNGSSKWANARGTPGSAQHFASAVGDIVYFSSDRSDITPEGQQTLSQQAQWLQQYPQNAITIEGHADERGTREYNIALGARRATSVKNYLAQNGVQAARMRTLSYGKERPVATCDDISCWSKNRRAQTMLNGVAVSQR